MDELKAYLEKLNISGADEKVSQLRQYMEGVLSWNEKVNLTAITDRQAFVRKHYIDSLMCAETLEFTGSSSICDVGTGGGFPGVPLAVCYPDKEFVLMDSLQKRVRIVRQLCEEIGAGNVTVIHGRAEELARKKEYRERFDLCVSRAVANMQVLSEYCLPFVRVGGHFIAYKGADCESEISDASRAIRILGGQPPQIRIPGEEPPQIRILGEEPPQIRILGEEPPQIRELPQPEHCLVVVRKKEPTPAAYPRRAGTPVKKPL